MKEEPQIVYISFRLLESSRTEGAVVTVVWLPTKPHMLSGAYYVFVLHSFKDVHADVGYQRG